MTQKLIVLGAAGNCFDIVEAARSGDSATPKFEVVGFLDDDPEKQRRRFLGVPVVGTLRDASRFGDCFFVNGIGNERSFVTKEKTIKRTEISMDRFVSVFHPTAAISPSAKIGVGSVVLANTTIGANAVLGAHVMVLPGCVVSHDCELGDYSIVTSGVTLCGGVKLSPSCYLGAGSVVLGGVSVGPNSLVGAGSVVLHDVVPNTVVCGNPAKKLR